MTTSGVTPSSPKTFSWLGIPAFGHGAGRLDVSHGPHDYIDEAAMRRCATVHALSAGDLPA